VAEVRPIGLRLIYGESLQTKEGLRTPGTQAGDGAAEVRNAAGVAAIAHQRIGVLDRMAYLEIRLRAKELPKW
jgi:hypothetical protein